MSSIESSCDLCQKNDGVYNYTLICEGNPYNEICICQECGVGLYGALVKVPSPNAALHIKILQAFLGEQEELKRNGTCEFCDCEKGFDYYLKSEGKIYSALDVCHDCAGLLEGVEMPSPFPISTVHKSLLKAYLDYTRLELKKYGSSCFLCGEEQKYYYNLKHDGKRYDIIGICEECGEILYGLDTDFPYPIKLVHAGALISFIGEAKKDEELLSLRKVI